MAVAACLSRIKPKAYNIILLQRQNKDEENADKPERLFFLSLQHPNPCVLDKMVERDAA